MKPCQLNGFQLVRGRYVPVPLAVHRRANELYATTYSTAGGASMAIYDFKWFSQLSALLQIFRILFLVGLLALAIFFFHRSVPEDWSP